MLKARFEIPIIMQITGLTQEDIKKLIENEVFSTSKGESPKYRD